MNLKSLLAVTLIGLVSGCASTKQYVHFPDQTKTVENKAKARVYVARPSIIGGAISMTVSDGDTLIGQTGPQGYLCWERNPGSMTVRGKSENSSAVSVNVESGKVYYFKQSPKMGFFIARNKISQVPFSEGVEMVEKCKPPKMQ